MNRTAARRASPRRLGVDGFEHVLSKFTFCDAPRLLDAVRYGTQYDGVFSVSGPRKVCFVAVAIGVTVKL